MTAISATPDGKVIAMTRMGDVWLYRLGAAVPLKPIRAVPLADGAMGPPPSGRPFGPPQGPPPWKSVAIAPAGDRLYLNNVRDEVRVWAIDGDEVREVHAGPVQRNVTAFALSADGKVVALGDARGNVTLVDTASGSVRGRLRPPEGEPEVRVDALAFAPDGKRLAVGGFERARLWSIGAVPEALVSLPGHRGRVSNLAFSADGRRLATGGDDGAVAVWELDRVRAELKKLVLDW
jgi:WD40 repeat protein